MSATNLSTVVQVCDWEALAVAVVLVARRDAKRGDQEAEVWLATVAPTLLGWVFTEIDPRLFREHLLVSRPVQVAKVGTTRRRRRAA